MDGVPHIWKFHCSVILKHNHSWSLTLDRGVEAVLTINIDAHPRLQLDSTIDSEEMRWIAQFFNHAADCIESAKQDEVNK